MCRTKNIDIKKCITIIIGAGILAFGVYNVHARCDISEGGVLGLSLLVFHWLGISPGISCFILDVSAMLVGVAILKGGFVWYSILAAAGYSLWYSLFELFPPVLPDLSAVPAMAAVIGGIFIGVGTGLIVRFGCAAGGDDAIALVVNKLTGLNVSAFYALNDFVILTLSLSYIPMNRIIWSLVSVMISSGIIEILRPWQKKADG